MNDPQPVTPEQLEATTDDLTPEEEALVERAAAVVDHIEPTQPRERTLHAEPSLQGTEFGIEGVIMRQAPLRLELSFTPTEAQRATIAQHVAPNTLDWSPDWRTAMVKLEGAST